MNKKAAKKIEKGQELFHKDKWDSIKKFKKAIKLIEEDGDEEDDLNYLAAHHLILLYTFYIEKENNTEEQIAELRALASHCAKKCYEILKPSIETNSFFAFDEGDRFRKKALRLAMHEFAWRIKENETDVEQLEKGLEWINIGCAYYDSNGEDLFVFDTKVRLLLKLNRVDEAYTIVEETLRIKEDLINLQDIKNSKEYIEWLNKPNEFNEEEKAFLRKANNLINKIPKTIIPEGIDKSNSYKAEILSLEETEEKYGFPESGMNSIDEVLILHGDVYIDGNLDMEWIEKEAQKHDSDSKNINNLLIKGNLYVTKGILDSYVDFLIVLEVTKDVYADYLQSEDGTLWFGNTYIRTGVYGVHNDGEINVSKLETPFLVYSDHDLPSSEEEDAIYIEGRYGDDREDVCVLKDSSSCYESSYKLFKEDNWDDDGFDVSSFFNAISKGENPFVELDEA